MSSIATTTGVRPGPESARPAPVLRLTRRGRLTVFLSCLAAICVALVLLAATAIGTGEAGEPAPTRVVTVQPGDTLWGIASRVAPSEDPRAVIEEIRDLNVVGPSLQAGDKLDVPVRR